MAWKSKAEDCHGEVAQGRSGDGHAKISKAKAWHVRAEQSKGMERSCFAEAKRSGTQCAGAWLVLFINQERKERNHEKV